MPFHNSYQQNPQSNPPYPSDGYSGTASTTYQAGQYIGSVGAPGNQWGNTKSIASAPPEDRAYQALNSTNGNAGGEQGLSLRSGPPSYGPQTTLPSISQPSAQFQTPRRTFTIGRQQEELHISHPGSAMSDVHHYGAPPSYGGDNGGMQLQPTNPQHPGGGSSQNVPGSLQPGSMNRPGPIPMNSAPVIPTLPQISTQMQQPPSSARAVPLTHTHSYSRSSPGSMDQPKYKPFSNTPEASKYASPTSGYMPQTPQGASSYSPLGLSDIRPRTELGFSEGPRSPGVFSDEALQYQSNSSYVAPWPIYALDWCKWPQRSDTNSSGKIAIGSYLEDNHNYIQILDAQKSQMDPDNPHAERGLDFTKTAEATHSYPVTRILWEPPSSNKQTTDLLATSGDHLRLWSLPSEANLQSNSINRSSNSKDLPLQKLSPLALLSNSKSPEHTAPITSLDWNVLSPSLIITSSIDTTCTIWDIPTLTAKTQLIAHDKEVFDVRFCAASVDVFVSCGADGSVRMFDLRSLEHSTIIYEPSDKQDKNAQVSSPDPSANTSPTRGNTQTLSFPPPLLRIAASPHDAHLLATFSQDSSTIRVLDVRQPGQALLELKGHSAPLNCMEWSNTQRGVLASGADDCCVLLWDLMGSAGSVGSNASAVTGNVVGAAGAAGGNNQERGPTAAWECGSEISNLSWAPTQGTVGVCGGKGFWGVQL